MPWSVADLRAFRLSVGDSLLSMPTISNLTPAGLLALNFSAANFQLFSWLLPTGPIRPESGSIQAILTTWPSSGLAAQAGEASAAATAAPSVRLNARRLTGDANVIFMRAPEANANLAATGTEPG